MKPFVLVVCLTALSTLAGAQTVAPESPQVDIAAERARISAERVSAEAGFLTEDTACYKKFFVNSCLNKVNTKRRAMIAELRRQEILLNDEERKLKGADQIRKTEEKLLPEKQQEAADRRTKALEDTQSRLNREKSQQQNRATVQAGEKAALEATAQRLKDNQAKARARTDKQAAAAEEAKKFNDRQKEAQERRAQHDADQLKLAKPPAKSLPLPE